MVKTLLKKYIRNGPILVNEGFLAHPGWFISEHRLTQQSPIRQLTYSSSLHTTHSCLSQRTTPSPWNPRNCGTQDSHPPTIFPHPQHSVAPKLLHAPQLFRGSDPLRPPVSQASGARLHSQPVVHSLLTVAQHGRRERMPGECGCHGLSPSRVAGALCSLFHCAGEHCSAVQCSVQCVMISLPLIPRWWCLPLPLSPPLSPPPPLVLQVFSPSRFLLLRSTFLASPFHLPALFCKASLLS